MLYTQMLDKALICYKTVKQSDSEYPELCARLLQLERANKLPMNAQEDDEARLQRLFGLACRGGDKTADLANEYFQQMSGVDTAWPVIAKDKTQEQMLIEVAQRVKVLTMDNQKMERELKRPASSRKSGPGLF